MFLVDQELCQRIIHYSNDRKHNYRKIQVGSHFTYAIYISSDDYEDPNFHDLDEIQQIFNTQQILLPIYDQQKKQTSLCIQLRHNSNSK